MIEIPDHLEPELLSAYLDDEVSVAERATITAHLPHCADCQRELVVLRQVRTIMSNLPLEPLPRTFYISEQMVAPEPTSSSIWERLWEAFGHSRAIGGAIAATAALLFLILVVPQMNLGGGSDSASRQVESADMTEAEVVELEATAVTVTLEAGDAEIAMAESSDEAANDAEGAEADAATDGLGDDTQAWESSVEESSQPSGGAAMESDAAFATSSNAEERDDADNVTQLRSESTTPTTASDSLGFPIVPILFLVAVALVALIWYYSRRGGQTS